MLLQELAVPALVSGRNVVLAAETGSGKTLAYLAPIVSQLLARRRQADTADKCIRPPPLLHSAVVVELAPWRSGIGVLQWSPGFDNSTNSQPTLKCARQVF